MVRNVLQASLNILPTLLENLPDAVLVVDKEGAIVSANKQAEGIFGHSKHKLLSLNVADLMPKRYRKQHKAHLSNFNQKNRTRAMGLGLELYALKATGEEIPVEISLGSFKADTGTYGDAFSVAVIRDLSEQKRLSRSLAESELKYHTVIEAMADGVIQYERKGGLSLINASALDLLGLTHEQLTIAPLDHFCSLSNEEGQDIRFAEDIAFRCMQTSQPQSLLIRVNKSANTFTWLLCNSIPLLEPASKRTDKCISTLTDVTHRKNLEASLKHAALHDPLTDLPRRNLLMDRLWQTFYRSQRDSKHKFALLYVDLDNFKAVNDVLGHQTGDQLLIETAQRLSKYARINDTVARLGGDEFAIILDDIHNLKHPERIINRFLKELEFSYEANDQSIAVSASIGAVFSKGRINPEQLLDLADKTMYQAKALGKGRYVIHDYSLTG